MEEILKTILNAESEGAKLKEEALKRAAEITAEAEARVTEIEKACEAECKNIRESSLRLAERQSEEEYQNTIQVRTSEAQSYADEVLKHTDALVKKITGRISGDR